MYDREISAAIAEWGPYYGVTIPASLVHGIIEKETRHGRLPLVAVEPNGDVSRGPMQVRAQTALDLGVHDPTILLDPATGIWYGVEYLAQQLKRFKGDVAHAIAAYNGGPGVKHTASGQYRNQTYVNDVLNFTRKYAMVAVPVAAGLALLTLLFLLRGRRAAVAR